MSTYWPDTRASRQSYKRECQETCFSARLRRKMLSCIQPPTPTNAHTLRLVVLDLAQQQRGSESDYLRFHACDRDDALGFLKLTSVVVAGSATMVLSETRGL
jgi:hypothetical protein